MKELKRFIKYWKPSKTFAYLYSVEAIFIFLLTITLNLWMNLHRIIFEKFSEPYGNLAQESTFVIEMMARDFKEYMLFFVILNVAIVLLLLVYWSVSRTLIWARLFKQKTKPFFKVALLKVIWQLIWVPILIFFIGAMFVYSDIQTEAGVNIYMIVMFANLALYALISYFGMHMYYSFFKNQSIYQALFDSFRNGFLKLKNLILPYIFLGITFFVFFFVLTAYQINTYLIVLILLYPLTVSRLYLFKKLK